MRVEFDWQVGAEDGTTETLARVGNRRRPRIRRWAWILLAATVASLVVVALLGVCASGQSAEDRAVFGTENGAMLSPGPDRAPVLLSEERARGISRPRVAYLGRPA